MSSASATSRRSGARAPSDVTTGRASRRLRAACTGVACAWVALILLAPRWASQAETGVTDGRSTIAALVRLAGARVCHQRPERSFHLYGRSLPVCGRCTGLYVAGAVGLLLVGIGRQPRVAPTSAGMPAWWPAGIDRRAGALVAAAVPTALTWGLEWAGVWQPGTLMRAIAALPLGLTAGWLVGRALGQPDESLLVH